MAQAQTKWDLAGWTKGTVKFFDTLGLKGAQYPQLKPRLAPAAATVAGPLQVSGIGGGGNNPNQSSSQSASVKGLKNPIGPGLVPGRIDMGVDYTGTGPLYAIGDGTITNIYNSGWPGGTFIGLKLDNGKYVYYAENINPQVRVNQKVKAGDLVGYARGGYPYVEVGWAAPPGTGETMAAKTGQNRLGSSQGDPGKYPTGYGVGFANLLKSLGAKVQAPSGSVQGSAPSGYS